jgi:hypothetical protein
MPNVAGLRSFAAVIGGRYFIPLLHLALCFCFDWQGKTGKGFRVAVKSWL